MLSKFSFGPPDNFVNAYVTGDGTQIVVVVQNSVLVPGSPWVNTHYLNARDNTFWYEVPQEFRTDVLKAMDGKYSEMSLQAKTLIRTYSGLNYKRERYVNGKKMLDTDARLMALEKHPDLRERLEYLLSVQAKGHAPVHIDPRSELMSPPDPAKEIWKKEKALVYD